MNDNKNKVITQKIYMKT